ncbi:1107_t:CDS:2 [Acaulospora colombiana]|uniref:1107_t:CDS:1 n=1 Tax=Acaulospora colombiana TaxID=27376 RepID=A0ACA9L133_9GLOM|nr:1107_t:CDS:2 [Acaulospora colombiana]
MKFGKQILNQQTTEWASYYINYKALKKIINSLQNHERSLTPNPITIGTSRTSNSDLVQADNYPEFLQQQKANFFFKLERELEKVNAFYLQKEDEFKVRLRTLNDKKRILLGNERRPSAVSTSLITLKEAFQKFQQDLNKLQQFVEINTTGFSKILKKWDKRSKSRTKELYLAGQVKIQPFFNREVIADLADGADNSLSELQTHIHGLSSTTPSSAPTSPERRLSISEPGEPDVMNDIETELFRYIMEGATSTVQEILDRVRQRPSDEDKDILSRVFWRACSEENSSIESINCLVDTNMVNFKYIDDISDRTCLHESAIFGKLPLMKICVEHNVKVNCSDVYGRKPLHYACMYGHSDAATYLLSKGADCECFDHDGFSPLIYAITNGHTKCVEILLEKGAIIEPHSGKGHNHIPLSLACQFGHKDIALLLLAKGARIIADADGLFPLHLTSRKGHHELSKILTEYGDFLNTPDNEGWSPIFYAASEGHVECVNVLIQAGCQVNIKDYLGRSPIYYAAWEGHIECIDKLHLAGGRVESEDEPMVEDATNLLDDRSEIKSGIDLIPSLRLPPPIMPLPIYGHNYLDKKYHIQITLGHPSIKPQRPPVHLYGNSHISSLKLLITPNPGMGMVPLSIILPLGDDRKVFSFQIDSLENFSLDFNIFPTFGSKVIGKGVALPHVFDISNDRERRNNLVAGGTGGKYICPLFDTYLKVVGELSFEFAIVKPFQGVRLEIGGQVETYWRSLLKQPPNVSGSVSSFVTTSSLSGEYIHLVVQVTRDIVAIVYPEWMLPVNGFDLSVSDVTYEQFRSINNDRKENFNPFNASSSAELQKMIHQAYLSLEEVLKKLPSNIGVNLEIKYPTVYEMTRYWFSDIPDINSYVDTILQTVYDHVQNNTTSNNSGSSNKPTNRSVIFSSFNPAICTALNWKQPNLFFNSFCGFENENVNRGKKRKERDGDGNVSKDAVYEDIKRDKRCTSIKEAVKFAKINNLLGLICEATLLEYISDRNHIHMNGTIWVTLTEYVKYLGKEGICNVDETPKGWYVSWIDNSPKALARQKFTELKRDNEDKIKLSISLTKAETSTPTPATSSTSLATTPATNSSVASTTHTSISFNKPVSQKMSLSALVKKSNALMIPKKEKEKAPPKKLSAMEQIILDETEKKKKLESQNGNGNGSKANIRRKDELKSRDYKDRDSRRDYRERDDIDREDREKEREYREKDRKHRERGRDRSYDRSYDRESKRSRRD